MSERVSMFEGLQEGQPAVGFLIGNASEEMLVGVRDDRRQGVCSLLWARHPDLAQVFSSRRQADRVIQSIGRFDLRVVPLFDAGRQWVVGWDW